MKIYHPTLADGEEPVSDLEVQHQALHAAMLSQLEETAARENHGVIYTLLGWEHLAACAATNYLIEMTHLEHPLCWPFLLPWLAWIAAALLTVRLVRGREAQGRSPLGVHLFRTWMIFFILCGNVVALNLATGLPLLVFLPVLAMLSTFVLLLLTALVSRRFLPAALLMIVTGLATARIPEYGFLIYGVAWLLILQGLGLALLRRRNSSL
jgi:hypothetical protein